MAKFDRKKFRETLKQSKLEKENELELELQEKSPAEKILITLLHSIKENRLRVFLVIVLLLVIFGGVIAVGEINQYRENQAILEAEALEKKLEKTSGLDDVSKIKEFETFIDKHSDKSAGIRISKQVLDLYLKSGDYQKASAYAGKIAMSVKSPKEIKAYFYYLEGNFSEHAGDKKNSLEAYKKALEQINGKKELVVMNSWTLFQVGRLKYDLGDKEGSISDLKKVLELESDQLEFALRQPKLMATYLILKINKG